MIAVDSRTLAAVRASHLAALVEWAMHVTLPRITDIHNSGGRKQS
jgi:hypothetical protein